MNPYLKSIPFLTDDDRAKLEAARFTCAEAFLGTSEATLIALGIPAGAVGQLLHHVRASATEQDVVTSEGKTVAALLRGLRGPHQEAVRTQLRSRGIHRVVVGDDGNVDEAATLAYIEDGAPARTMYSDKPVVTLDRVGGRLHHPRTGERLTRGDFIPWITLGRERLLVAAAIMLVPELSAQASDQAVFDDVEDDCRMAKAATKRLRWDAALRGRAEARIDGAREGDGSVTQVTDEQLRVLVLRAMDDLKDRSVVEIALLKNDYPGQNTEELARRVVALVHMERPRMHPDSCSASVFTYRGSGAGVELRKVRAS